MLFKIKTYKFKNNNYLYKINISIKNSKCAQFGNYLFLVKHFFEFNKHKQTFNSETITFKNIEILFV